jgi:hypothetical protein
VTRASLALLLAAATAGSARAAGPESDPAAAFRSIGPPPIPLPPTRAAGDAGPRTDYHPNGRPRSHGLYVTLGDRAVAQGVFTFWTANGNRQSQGRYAEGKPVGCFAVWMAGGERITGFADDGGLRVASCEPPRDAAAEVLEVAHGGGADAQVDLTFETFVAPGASVGARTHYTTDDPKMRAAIMALWRQRVGPWRLGGAAAARPAEDGYTGISGSGLAGWGRRATSWLDLEVWSELGLLWVHAKPEIADQREGVENVWTPFAAAHGEAAWRIAQEVELTAGARLEVRYPREIYRQTIFCRAPCDPRFDTWHMGGVAAGFVVGLRFLVW